MCLPLWRNKPDYRMPKGFTFCLFSPICKYSFYRPCRDPLHVKLIRISITAPTLQTGFFTWSPLAVKSPGVKTYKKIELKEENLKYYLIEQYKKLSSTGSRHPLSSIKKGPQLAEAESLTRSPSKARTVSMVKVNHRRGQIFSRGCLVITKSTIDSPRTSALCHASKKTAKTKRHLIFYQPYRRLLRR